MKFYSSSQIVIDCVLDNVTIFMMALTSEKALNYERRVYINLDFLLRKIYM